MEQLKDFPHHKHPLSLVYLRTENHHKDEDSDNENSDDEDDGRDDSVVVLEQHGGKCNMCKEDIYSFHLCYYHCKECNYSLHKFCAELPLILQNHQFHRAHNLTLINESSGSWYHQTINGCDVCNRTQQDERFFGYHCSICKFNMDIVCATMPEQKMVHPSHPHQLRRMIMPIKSRCHACGHDHKGIFYHCTTCFGFWIHLDCALSPAKLLIQQTTLELFTHSHPLTLAYSFPFVEYEKKYYPRCRVCDILFKCSLWYYGCDKCMYYAHVDCATSKKKPLMSLSLLTQAYAKTVKNFQDDGHPNLLKCPFPDESYNVLKHTYSNLIIKDNLSANDGKRFNHFGHQHLLVLFSTQTSLLSSKSVSLHNPMEKIQLLCDACVKPIVTIPFYKCCQQDCSSSFVLHAWCAVLPSEIRRDHPGHPQHSVLSLIGTRTPDKNLAGGIYFTCGICELPCNGFAYGCTTCGYYVDINCAFTPKEITHEAHPNHLLSLVKHTSSEQRYYCVGCFWYLKLNELVYHCPACNFNLHTRCALLLPNMVRHKYDKHPLSLRYEPAKNHAANEYFCDICEEELNPRCWFYHCSTCDASMHSACAPLILQSEKAVIYGKYYQKSVFQYLNVKFGGSFEIGGHPHRFTFDQGIPDDGRCRVCNGLLLYHMIFKCFECKFSFHHSCASAYALRGI